MSVRCAVRLSDADNSSVRVGVGGGEIVTVLVSSSVNVDEAVGGDVKLAEPVRVTPSPDIV